jgi:alcohol dehydrogenase (cytochrome c)
MKQRTLIVVSALGLSVVAVSSLNLRGLSSITAMGVVFNTFASANNPKGSAVVEARGGAATTSTGTPNAADTSSGATAQPSDAGNWPSYNRTLTSQRYSPLSQINTQTVRGLRVLCSYDTELREAFQTGPLIIEGL